MEVWALRPLKHKRPMKQIVIIGNGIAGITAARHIRKQSDHRILVISSESAHFYSRTALMYVYMGHMKLEHTKPYEDWFWKKNRIELLQDKVVEIQSAAKTLQLEKTAAISYDTLIIATGSTPQFYGWPGQQLQGVQGLYSQQDLANLEQHAPHAKQCKRAVVVGGGLIGVELAEMLHSRHIPVTFLVREADFWNGVLPKENAQFIAKHIRSQGIDLKTQTSLKEIKGSDGKVTAVTTDKGETIACDLVGITTGVRPNIDFLDQSDIATDRGVLVNPYLETNIPEIYAIGDCAQQQEPMAGRRAIEAVWYTGRMMGETLAQTICGRRTPYRPGHWFNSAKFFDIEYQTYGTVPSERDITIETALFHWQHPEKNLALSLAFHPENKQFLGANSFGMRLRHEILDRWLSEKQRISYVLAHWADANFDPEFYSSYHQEILNAYATQTGHIISPQKKSWKRIFNRQSKMS